MDRDARDREFSDRIRYGFVYMTDWRERNWLNALNPLGKITIRILGTRLDLICNHELVAVRLFPPRDLFVVLDHVFFLVLPSRLSLSPVIQENVIPGNHHCVVFQLLYNTYP